MLGRENGGLLVYDLEGQRLATTVSFFSHLTLTPAAPDLHTHPPDNSLPLYALDRPALCCSMQAIETSH